MELVTADLALEALRAEVAGNEEFVYVSDNFGKCTYERDGKPSCLVGKALVRLGATVDQLRELDGSIMSSAECLFEEDVEGLTVDIDASDVFAAAQRRQDCGAPWREALADAEKRYATLNERLVAA